MIGYMIEQELGNLLPFEKPLATLLTMVEVDPDDPAFADPTKFVGQVYDEAEAKAEAASEGLDGEAGRRQVAPRRALAAAEADLPVAADPVAAGEGHRRDRRWRRRHSDDVRAGHERGWSGSNASSTRTGPPRSSPARSGRASSYARPTPTRSFSTGASRASGRSGGRRPRRWTPSPFRPARWGRRSRRRRSSPVPPAAARSSARCPTLKPPFAANGAPRSAGAWIPATNRGWHSTDRHPEISGAWSPGRADRDPSRRAALPSLAHRRLSVQKRKNPRGQAVSFAGSSALALM